VQDNQTGTLASFDSYYTTRWQDTGNVSNLKMWRRPDLIVKQVSVPTSLTVQAFHDWDDSTIKRSSVVAIGAVGTGLFWSAYVGAAFDAITLELLTEGDVELVSESGGSTSEPDGVTGWSEGGWGAAASGSQYTHGGNLGLARAVKLKFSGPGGAAWGVDSISYKYNPRKVRS